MAPAMPIVEITFRQKATSLIRRSERGFAILIIRDSTGAETDAETVAAAAAEPGTEIEPKPACTLTRYDDLTAAQADEAYYTPENFAALADILAFAPFRTYVARLPENGALTDALALIRRKVKTGWITVANMMPEDATALSSWIQAQEKQKHTYKAVVYKPSVAPDCMHVVNFGNESITFSDARGEQNGAAYLPSLIGILAKCNVESGCTAFACSNLADVQELEDNNEGLAAGLFLLAHDDDGAVIVAQGSNSMTTTNGQTRTEDMQFIETVEAMDLIQDDITATFRQTYMGKYPNDLNRQMLFISALNFSYFKQLEQQDILDPSYDNHAEIDVDAQRLAWQASGKEEAAEWDDDQVKAMSFKRSVFLRGSIKILGSMTDLFFPITLA